MTRPYDMTRQLQGRYCSAIFILLLCLLMAGTPSYGRRTRPPDTQITFWRKDKRPYGAYIAYQDLSHIFRNADIKVSGESFSSIAQQGGSKKALIFIGHFADMDESEINAMMRFIGDGNHVFISALHFGDSLLHAVNLKVNGSEVYGTRDKDSLGVSVLQPGTGDSLSYAYPGFMWDTYVSSLDSQYATVLGRDRLGRPNMIRFRYKGGGSLILHFAPLAFSNYFLLHRNNIVYYDNALSYIPEDVTEVLWDESFRYGTERRSFSALSFISKIPSLWSALILLLLLLLIVYLFESKRRQRIVPVIEGLRNNSLDFVQTIGRLYYQRRDNQNLVGKMATHFLDHIRTKYNLSIHLSDETFVDRLSWKTGVPKEFLNVLKGDLLRMQQSRSVADEELLALNKKLEEFYKQA